MKYLVSAYSVNPYKGSEDNIGWNWLIQYSKNVRVDDEVYLITKKYNEEDTLKGMKEKKIKNVKLIIVDVPKYLNWFREKYSIFHHMYYILWQYYAYKWVKKSKIEFDVIHHVTMNDYRIIGKMYKFKKAYTILGPVGGAQVTPKNLKCYETNKIQAQFRKLVNLTCDYNLFYKNALRKFDKIYAINEETQKQIENITKKKCEILPELAIREEYKYLDIKKEKNDMINILFVGRLIGKKGVFLLIDIAKNLPENFRYILKIYGDGKEKKKVKKKIKEYELDKKIILMGARKFEEIQQAYKDADMFIMPSLRETSGNVLLEAMAHKLPIIGIDMSFEHQLKEIDCGIFVNPNLEKEKIIENFCNAIVQLSTDNDYRKFLGENGYRYVNEELTWEKKNKIIYREKTNEKK